MKTTLAQLGEDRLIHLLTRRWPGPAGAHRTVAVGAGDDCAALRVSGSGRLLLLKTDAIVECVHFRPDETPSRVGWKALARCLSDIAAMGGAPDAALVCLAAPSGTPVARLRGIYRGLGRCATRFGVALVGGETVRAREMSLTITATGWVARRDLVLRSGARPGDALCVTGRLGGSGAGHHLAFSPRLDEAQWLVRHARPTAMMDLSDGLAADLPRLCKASGVGARIDTDSLPVRRGATLRQALSEGEDYELLCAIPPSRLRQLRRLWPFPTPITRIGEITARRGIVPALHTHGYDHFRKP